ncbi:MAG TPA: FAD-binding oxidoreductase [Azonexus sp.]|nr:FAD-binding oxidoreductase [Azonexus sp.]
MTATLISDLCQLLGDDAVTRADAIDARYRTEFFSSQPVASQPCGLVRPRSTEELSAILKLCHRHGQAIVVQGGMTGLSGGALPGDGELIVSLERLRGVEEIDTLAGTMTVLAATPLQEAQEAAAAQGLLLAIDLGARGSCHVAGNVATNAGGNRVIRYGMARQQVLGLEVVLADGTVIRSLNKMLKNNAGFDLKHLFIGSEGTLGIITRVVFKLEPLPTCAQTALCAVASYGDVVALLRHAQRMLSGRLSAFEVMWSNFYDLVTKRLPGQRTPLPHGSPFYVLLDMQGSDAVMDAALFEKMLEQAMEDGLVSDAVIAASEKETQSLWKMRDAPGEFPVVWPIVVSFDISLPIGAIGPYAEALHVKLDSEFPGCEYVTFGHIGDSNLHVCVHVPGSTAETFPEHAIKDCLYGLLRDYGGSVSAEHGIGTHKREYLPYCRTPEEIALMRTLKAALDPTNILNPGRVLPEQD